MRQRLRTPAAVAKPTPPAASPTAPPTDDQLVARVLADDTAAFALLTERYMRPVYSLAYRLLGNAADAEDAAQETFVRAYTHLAGYRPGGRFGSWLLAITSHWCIDHRRRRQPISLETVTEGVSLPVAEELPETAALRAERQSEVQGWLAALPEPYRLVLVLRYWQDLSYAEISQVTGQPVSTVRMRLFRARQSLGKCCRAEHGLLQPLALSA